MLAPSGENAGSVSVLCDCVRRRGSPPLALIRYSCEPPSRDSVTARLRPSGDQAYALSEPLKLASRRRRPLATSCT